jgi:hypothetical protein
MIDRVAHVGEGWVAALLDPVATRWTPTLEPSSLVRALALLVDARFLDYQNSQPQYVWPPFGTIPGVTATPAERLVAAVALQLTGSGAAMGQFEMVFGEQTASSELTVAARVFASIAARDSGRPDIALRLWDELPGGSLERSLALIHRSLCQRELGDLPAALESALAAEDAADRIEASQYLRAGLRAVATRNVAGLAFPLGRGDLVDTRRGPTLSSLLDNFEARRADSLEALIPDEFDARLHDPGEQTLSFRREDPVQAPLIAGLLRAEVLGDWQLLHTSRTLLGRHQLAASVGASNRQPTPALHLLRRGDDTKGLQRSIKWYRSEGPLPPIREYGDAVAVIPWLPSTVRSDLGSLREAADVMSPPAADAALRRLLEQLPNLYDGVPGSRLEDPTNRAVAALLEVASSDLQAAAAQRFREILGQTNDDLVLQSAAAVLDALRWDSLPPEELPWWYSYCAEHLTGGTSHRFTASSLLRSLPATPGLRAAARRAFRQQPDLLTGANLLVLGGVSHGTASRISRLARRDLARIRSDAHKGSHGFGAYIDAGSLVTQLLIDYPGTPGWRDLVAFLLDPQVAASKRVGPLRRILSHPRAVPQLVDRALARWATGRVDFVPLPLEADDEFRAVVLRVRARYRVRSRDELLSELVKLTTAPSRSTRFMATRELPELALDLPEEAVLTLAMALSRDPASEVRGAASASLPRLAGAHPNLAQVAWDRVEEAMREPGARVPGWVIAGLAEVDRTSWPPELGTALEELRSGHLSATVRRLAADLLNRFESPPTPASGPIPSRA